MTEDNKDVNELLAALVKERDDLRAAHAKLADQIAAIASAPPTTIPETTGVTSPDPVTRKQSISWRDVIELMIR